MHTPASFRGLRHRLPTALVLLSLFTVTGLLPAGALAQRQDDSPGVPAAQEDSWILREAVHRVEAAKQHPRPLTQPPTPTDFDVHHYEIRLTINTANSSLAGQTDIVVESEADDLAAVLLHLKALTVSAVRIGATPLAYTHVGDNLTVQLDRIYTTGEVVTFTVDYSGTPSHESWGGFWFHPEMAFSIGVGLYTDPPSMGRNWFPCFDEPQDKATVTAHYTVREDWIAVGTGLLTAVTPNPANHTITYSWSESHPTSTYLVSVSAADWAAIPDPVYPALIRNYVLPSDSVHAVTSFQNVHRMMDAYTTRYAPYQFDKFGFVGVRVGDMEHQTMVAHLRTLINGNNYWDPILAHELSHHWWGDWVTVGDWRDVWLSEGFATFSEAIYQEHLSGLNGYHTSMNGIMDYYLNSGETFPIYDPVSMWGATSYEKGGAVLHMLRRILGDATFFHLLQQWGTAHGFGNALTSDFTALAETVSGSDLDWFFDQWIYEAGYPRYEWHWRATEGGAVDTLRIHVNQVQSIGPDFRMPVDFRVTLGSSGNSTVTAVVDQASQDLLFTFPQLPTAVAFDPERWVLCRKADVTSGVRDTAPAGTLSLRPMGPNPFQSATTILLTTKDPVTPVELTIHDSTGRLMRDLGRECVQGTRAVRWDGRDDAGNQAASGIYFLRARQEAEEKAHRVLLLRS